MSIYAKVWLLKATEVFVNPRWLNSNSSPDTEHMNPSCIAVRSANTQNSWFFSQ